MRNKIPEFSNEVIATSIGITVVQTLDFYADEVGLSEEDTQGVWSPFLAATARLIKPADDMASIFLNSSKTKKVKAAISAEINGPFLEFYEPFNKSVQEMLGIIAKSLGEVSYLDAVANQGLINKIKMAKELVDMVDFYMEDQNLKGRKVQHTDEAFKTIFCTVVPQHIEDTLQSNLLNGVKNTGKIFQVGQVVFTTALLLQIIKGMLS